MTDYIRGYPAPTLEALLTFLTPRMQQYCDGKILRSEFRFLKQLADESIQDFARRIRIAAEGVFCSLPDEAGTIHMKEQFLDGLQDHEIQTKMLEDETNRDLSQQVVQILPTPLLQPLFERIEEIKEVIPEQMMGEIHQRLLGHLKMNLAGFPDQAITDTMLMTVLDPFVEEVKSEHGRAPKEKLLFSSLLW